MLLSRVTIRVPRVLHELFALLLLSPLVQCVYSIQNAPRADGTKVRLVLVVSCLAHDGRRVKV